MARTRADRFPLVLTGLLLLGLLPAAFATPAVTVIPFGANGDGNTGSVGAPVPLSPSAFLCAAAGADDKFGTADDVVLLVTNAGGSTITPLSTPYLSTYSGRIVRLSATRALCLSAGTDGKFNTADDTVLLLDQLGTTNSVTPLVIGALDDSDSFSPVALSYNSAVVASYGPDATVNTADDEVVVLSDLGGGNTLTPLAAPYLDAGQSRATPLSPTSFLVPSNGPDLARTTADDVVYLFTGAGPAKTRTDLSVPYLCRRAPRQSVRLSATRAVVASAGPDGVVTSADDRLMLLDGLGTTNTITPIAVPDLADYAAGLATALSDTMVAVATEGADGVQNTGDEKLAVVTGLGTTNTVTLLDMPGLDEDVESKPVRLSPTRIAVATGGHGDFKMNTADDEVALVDGVGTTNTVYRYALPGIGYEVGSQIVPLSASTFLINHGGADAMMGTGTDDQTALMQVAGSTSNITEIPAAAPLDPSGGSCTPQLLGHGAAVYVTGGANAKVGNGHDDTMRVITGLPQLRFLTVKKLKVTYNPRKPAAPETFSASGTLMTDDPGALLGGDLTLSLGNAAETIPAALLKRSRTGVYTFSDTHHTVGGITRLTLDPVKHKWSVTGKAAGSGLRTFNAGYVPVSIRGQADYLADAVRVVATHTGYHF